MKTIKRKPKKKYSKEKLEKELKKKEKKAKKILQDVVVFEEIQVKIKNKIDKAISAVGEVIDELKLLFELVTDVVTRKYDNIPIGSLLMITGALLYFLAPFDLAPDILPFIGFTDDISAILLVIRQVKKDLDNYKEWIKKGRKIKKRK